MLKPYTYSLTFLVLTGGLNLTRYESSMLRIYNRVSDTVLMVILVSISIIAGEYPFFHLVNVNANAQPEVQVPLRKAMIFGAWVPSELHLEEMPKVTQIRAIYTLLEQGFREYYFVMKDFTNATETKTTEEFLNSADGTGLGIFIILLPPSEGGSSVNYHWEGWIDYFNLLKTRHESFLGFAIDDFNASDKTRRVYLMNTVDRMNLTKLPDALDSKRKDVDFYPVLYMERGEIETVKKEYSKYATGLILVSVLYQNVTHLESYLTRFSEMFPDKPIKYIVYPTKTSWHTPSDRLIMATLSIASRGADGIIIYVYTNHHVIRDYMHNYDNPFYISAMGVMEILQIMEETRVGNR